DNKRFGILWMPYRRMAAAFNMEGAFNDALIELQPRANSEEVIFQVDRLMSQYGSTGAYDRSEQHSNRWVSDELHQLKGMARVTPSLFLAVAIALFNIVLSRMVHQQQEQVATLRAFGYSRRDVGAYYLKFVLVLVVLGSIAGIAGGALLGNWMTHAYVKFFRFPMVQFTVAFDLAVVAVSIGAGGAIVGSFNAVRRAVRLQPAVAMRPEAPKSSGRSIPERMGLRAFLSPVARMVFRRLERSPRSTLLSVFGMSLGVAVLILGTFLEDAVTTVIDIQFERAQRQDVTLAFNENLSSAAVHDVRNLPGVREVEPFRAVPIRIRHGHRTRRESLMAVEARAKLFRILDDKQQPVHITGTGLTLSQKMAEMMGLAVGDELTIELLEGRRPVRKLLVDHIFPDFSDPGIYMNREALHELLGEGEQHSGVFVRVDENKINDLYAAVKQIPAASGITVKAAAINTFNDTFRENLRPMRVINGMFGFTIAFGVIYSCALITLAERSRDLATLRVMGFTRWEVSRVLLGELAVITLLAIPIGLPVGWWFASIATAALDTETHRFPLIMTNRTFAYAASIILISAAVSALIVRRMLDKLDLISVLKVKA
ncbi:MAG: ABC transporter permease, partial [Planctomycetaceae bacterium]